MQPDIGRQEQRNAALKGKNNKQRSELTCEILPPQDAVAAGDSFGQFDAPLEDLVLLAVFRNDKARFIRAFEREDVSGIPRMQVSRISVD